MEEYRKIPNIFKFDAKYKEIVSMNEPFESLKSLKWIGTEKVDGTNIRIHWDGYKVEIRGRTNSAKFQGGLYEYLESQFMTKESEYIFEQMFEDKDVVLYGEGYGPKIQAGGGLYSDSPKFIMYDIDMGHYHLPRTDVKRIAENMNIDIVPVVFYGTLDEAKRYVSEHQMSIINNAHEMEGLVLELPLDVFDKNGQRIKCKCKYRDMLKAGLAHE